MSANNYKSSDPFPSIKPALLNSADILDYATATSMIKPFHSSNLKPASYEVEFDGIVYSWDENGDKHETNLNEKISYKLKKNSIAFLFTKVKFNLPDYIALRFNLKITHVHRGLLLGTGPLVDPGFEGNLLIPLHNLTTNDYELRVGEGLIWVEFTKLSENDIWKNESDLIMKKGEYVPFLEDKKNKDAHYYFNKATGGRDIRSSIPDAMQQSAKDAERAKDISEKLETRSTWTMYISVIGIVVAIIAISISLYLSIAPALQLAQDSVQYIKGEGERVKGEQTKILDRLTKIENKLEGFMQQQNDNIDIMQRIEKLEISINSFEKPKTKDSANKEKIEK